MDEAELLLAFKKYPSEHLNLLGMEDYGSGFGGWD